MNTINDIHTGFLILFVIGTMLQVLAPRPAHAFDWVPTDEEIKKYRQSHHALAPSEDAGRIRT